MKIRRILAYHRITEGDSALCVSPSVFSWQMEYLKKKGLNAGTLSEYISKNVDICLTFDDGWEDNFTNGFPIIKRLKFNFTIFLILGKIGSAGYVGWDMIKQMVKHNIEIGSHTISHPKLTQIPIEDAKKEIFQSRSILEEKLNIPIKYFCYPSGDYNENISCLVAQAGYLAAVITPPVRNIPQGTFSLHRTGIYKHNNKLIFRLKLFGVHRWLLNV
jgi:peptidoglycan/xylan/chitin deacetylase (PgdA/CDA1 family)